MQTTARRRWTQNVAVAAVLTVLFALLILSVVPPGPGFLDMPRPVFNLVATLVPDGFPGKSSDDVGDAPALAPSLPAPSRQAQDSPDTSLVAFVSVVAVPPAASPSTQPAGAPLVPTPPSVEAEEPARPTGSRTVTSVPPLSPAEERALAKGEKTAAKAENAAARAEAKAKKAAEKTQKVPSAASAASAEPASAAAASSRNAAPAVKPAPTQKDHAVKKATSKPPSSVKKPGRSKAAVHEAHRPPGKGKAVGDVRQAKQDKAPPAKKSVATRSKK